MPPPRDRPWDVPLDLDYRDLAYFGLFVRGIEVTQAVQHYRANAHLTDPADRGPDNSLRLVSEKPAWVRVYVGSVLGVSGVTGTLEVQRRKHGFLWGTIATLNPQPPGNVNTPFFATAYATERGALGSTLNFIIPANDMCGTLRLIARISGGHWTAEYTTEIVVILQQTLRLAGVMIAYNGPTSSTNATNLQIAAPTLAELQAMSGTALTLFPVRAVADFRAGGMITWDRHLQDPFGTTGCTTNWDALHAAVVNARTADGNQAGWVYYGLLPTGVPMGPVGGCGGGGVSVGPVGAALTMAHEIGHSCDLEHAPCGSPPRPDANYPAYEPYDAAGTPQGSIGEFGLDVNNGNIKSPATFKDFMSYCGPKWISPYHHGLLVDNAMLNPATVCVDEFWWDDLVWEEWPRFPRIPIPDPPPFNLELPMFPPAIPPMDVISLIVRIERGAVAEVAHVARTRTRPQVEGAVATRLIARLLSDDGTVISKAPLLRLSQEAGGCDRCRSGSGGAEPDSYLGQSFIPDLAPGSSLEISDGKTTLWERKAPQKPVTIQRFRAVLGRNDILNVNWSVTGNAVEFWLRWSTDGERWQALATGLRDLRTRVDARFLPPGKVLLQLVAHDGFFSSRSKIIKLVIRGRAPEVAILHPREGYTYQSGQTFRLWGAGTAADGRAVPFERCVWTLDGKEVGRGLDVWITAPKAGKHKVALHARDKSGTSSAIVTFLTIAPTGAKRRPRRRR
jgi:hypothetical protein